MIGEYCVVRTYSAGVHVGIVESCHETAVIMTNARLIHSWDGAFSLNEISLTGVGPGSKLSKPVARIGLTEAIALIPCTPLARKNLEEFRAA